MIIDQEFYYQYLKFLWFWTLKAVFMTQLAFYHFRNWFWWTYSTTSLLESYLDFPEYILIIGFYRFIQNFETAIKDKEVYSSNLCKTLRDAIEGWWWWWWWWRWRSFSSKVKIRGMVSRLSEYILKQAVL